MWMDYIKPLYLPLLLTLPSGVSDSWQLNTQYTINTIPDRRDFVFTREFTETSFKKTNAHL